MFVRYRGGSARCSARAIAVTDRLMLRGGSASAASAMRSLFPVPMVLTHPLYLPTLVSGQPEHLDEAQATRAIGDADTIAHALFLSHWAWWVNGDLDATRRALLEALQHIEATGAERHLGEVLGALGASAAFRGAFVEAAEYAVRANERAASSGLQWPWVRMSRSATC